MFGLMEASGRWRPVGVGRLSSVGRVGARDAAPEWRAGTGPRPTARSACRPFVAGGPPSGSTSSAADDVAGCGTSLHDLRTRRLVRGGGRRTVRPQSPSRLCASDSTPGVPCREVPDRRLEGLRRPTASCSLSPRTAGWRGGDGLEGSEDGPGRRPWPP